MQVGPGLPVLNEEEASAEGAPLTCEIVNSLMVEALKLLT
jgi:hypothetical protein